MSDLSQPLGRRSVRQTRPARAMHLPVARLAALGIVLLVGAAALRVIVVDTPDGGRPSAEVALASARGAGGISSANSRSLPDTASVITIGPEMAPEELEAALLREPSGKVAPAQAAGSAAGAGSGTPPALGDAFGALPELVETTEFGSLPVRSATGRTPFAAYSRPLAGPAAAAGRPRIALLVTGLGINVSGTLQAIARLPDTVSLAFAPYGNGLERTVGAARAEGHEVYIEIPLEPFDYPENDPGPDTLLTGQSPRENIARLYRILSRMGGYAGVVNNMGARFTASAPDIGPVIEELGARGLAYIDDGSSNRSLAPQLTRANSVPFARVELMVDASPVRTAIVAQLDRLEAAARRDGQALGLATALPVTIETLVEWIAGATERGLVIVPASALMARTGAAP